MKKLGISILAIVAFHLSSSAQFTEKSVFLGGTANYTYGKYGTSSTVTSEDLTIQPEVSYLLSKNTAVGFSVAYLNSSTFASASSYKDTQNMITPSLFIQMFHPITTNLYWAIKAEVGYGWFEITRPGYNKSSYNVLAIALSPELHYFITPRVGMKASIEGASYAHKFLSGDDSNQFRLVLNPSTWSFGFFVKI